MPISRHADPFGRDAIRAWTEIGDRVARTGCRKLVFINSHGGNDPAIDTAALDLRGRWRMLAVHATWRRLGYPDGLFSPRERPMASMAAISKPR